MLSLVDAGIELLAFICTIVIYIGIRKLNKSKYQL